MANIKNYLDNIKNAVFGKEVRGSIHNGIDAINKEVESTTGRQEHLEATFDELIINAGNSNAEIVDARVGENGQSFNKLGDRLDNFDSQLEHIQNKINYSVLEFGAKGDGVTDDTINIQKALDYIKTVNGGKILIPDTGSDFIISDNLYVHSNTILEFEGSYIKLIKATATGAVITRDYQDSTIIKNVKIVNPLINANNIAGQNGIGFGNGVERISTIGGHILGCKRDAAIGGGRAVTYQLGAKDCQASDFIAENCTTAYDLHGILDKPCVGNIANNIHAYNCDEVLSFYNLVNVGERSAKAINGIITNITAKNCGTLDGGLIVSERASNIKVDNMICVNDSSYGKIGGIVRGKMHDSEFNNINFIGELEAICNGIGATNIQPVISNSNATFENIKMNNVIVNGTTDFGVCSASNSTNTTFKDVYVQANCSNITSLFNDSSKVKTGVYVDIKNSSLNKIRKGNANLLNAYADIDFSKSDSDIEYIYKSIGDFSISRGSSGATFGTTSDIDVTFRRNSTDMLQLNSDGTKIIHSSWDGRHLMLGNWHIWIDTEGNMRYGNQKPTASTDGKKILTE